MTNFPKTGTSIAFNKHIVFVTPGFPENEEDTQCIPALWIYARALAEHGAKVSVIALQYPYAKAAYKWHHIDVYPVGAANRKWKQLLLEKRTIQLAKQIHNNHPIDVLHAFWLHRATAITKTVANVLGIPMMATAMGQEMRFPTRLFRRWKHEKFPIVALSEFQYDALKEQGVLASKTISWGVDKRHSSVKEVDLVCVGSLIPLKNVSYFIELCSVLQQKSPNFKAVIVGDGPQRAALELLVVENQLASNVTFRGALDYAETQNVIAQSRVLVHASEFEGFGMTIIEALAAGTHVLATPVGIAKQLEIPHLIGDSALDVAMLQMLLRSPEPEPMQFPIDDTVKKYTAIYASVSKEKASDS